MTKRFLFIILSAILASMYLSTVYMASTEAPIDNIAIIELLREEAASNNGLLDVDTSHE